MKYLKSYKLFEGYGGRSGPATMDLDEIQTINDIPEGYHIKYYKNRELTTHEKEIVKSIFEKYTSVVIPKDVIMDRLYDITDMGSGVEIEIRNQIYHNGDFIDMVDIENYDLHNLIGKYSLLKRMGEEAYAISNIDITFPIEEEQNSARAAGDDYSEVLIDGEGFHQASGMANTTIKDFFESYAKCEVECETYNTTISILIRYK